MTVGEITKWIWENRHKGRAFSCYETAMELAEDIDYTIEHGNILCAFDSNNQLIGVALFKKDEQLKIAEASSTLTTSKEAIGLLVRKFREMYPDWKFITHHRKKRKEASSRYFQKLQALSTKA